MMADLEKGKGLGLSVGAGLSSLPPEVLAEMRGVLSHVADKPKRPVVHQVQVLPQVVCPFKRCLVLDRLLSTRIKKVSTFTKLK